jgi:hypothetical protein
MKVIDVRILSEAADDMEMGSRRYFADCWASQAQPTEGEASTWDRVRRPKTAGGAGGRADPEGIDGQVPGCRACRGETGMNRVTQFNL